jgi:Arc/MetJ family transcription regulator
LFDVRNRIIPEFAHGSSPLKLSEVLINIDDELLEQAQQLSGLTERTQLIREALRALVQRESARRLAQLGGTQPELKPVPRRQDTTA